MKTLITFKKMEEEQIKYSKRGQNQYASIVF